MAVTTPPITQEKRVATPHFNAFEMAQRQFDHVADKLQEGWGRFLAQVRERAIDRTTKCLRCSLRPLCGTCPANSKLECGDPQQPVDFLCRVAHLRAYALGLLMPPHGDCEHCPGGAGHAEMKRMAEGLKVMSDESE